MKKVTLKKCCSRNCPYQGTCFRHGIEAEVLFDYEYTCCQESGYQDFIPKRTEYEKEKKQVQTCNN